MTVRRHEASRSNANRTSGGNCSIAMPLSLKKSARKFPALNGLENTLPHRNNTCFCFDYSLSQCNPQSIPTTVLLLLFSLSLSLPSLTHTIRLDSTRDENEICLSTDRSHSRFTESNAYVHYTYITCVRRIRTEKKSSVDGEKAPHW